MTDADRLAQALAAIDRANADDPTTLEVAGQVRPKEQLHAELMSAVGRASRSRRPTRPSAWPLGPTTCGAGRSPATTTPTGGPATCAGGRVQKARHAELVADILREAGYEPATIDRVGQIIRKEHLRTDPAVQVHEDALCLTFLQTQLGAARGPAGRREGRPTSWPRPWPRCRRPGGPRSTRSTSARRSGR